MEHAFEREGYRRVEFKTDSQNERSRAALAALPAEFEGVFRKHMLVRGGERRDSAWYAVIDDDWAAVKAALRERLAGKAAAREA
jgi:RimJ/RimL family protein N-acetyltransferase